MAALALPYRGWMRNRCYWKAPATRGNWLRLKLTGTKSNRQAVGARVKVTAGGLTQYGSVRAGGSYLSSNDPRLHFGLGSASQANIEVTWPGGGTEKFIAVPSNRQLDIRER